jgi:hypothetical protein
VALELIGGLVVEEFHAVVAFDQRHALGDEAFEFDGADLRAVRLLLAAPLRLLVVVERVTRPVARWKRLTVDQSRSSRSGSRRVSLSVETSAAKMSATAPPTVSASGSGLGSGSSWKGRCP